MNVSRKVSFVIGGLVAALSVTMSAGIPRATAVRRAPFLSLYSVKAATTTTPGAKHDEYSTSQGVPRLVRETLSNPERGFYAYDGGCGFDQGALTSYRSEGISLVQCVFLLPQGKLTDEVARFTAKLVLARSNGFKVIVRFSYGPLADDSFNQPSMSTVTDHLTALGPVLTANANVIAVVQSGFIGRYGEGVEGGADFGTDLAYNPTQQSNRKSIVTSLLAALPSSRMVQVRTPRMKAFMSSNTAATSVGSSRIGHHNDCFLRSTTAEYNLAKAGTGSQIDSDTFKSVPQGAYNGVAWTSINPPWTIAEQLTYTAADSAYVAMGGETCVPSSGAATDRAGCVAANGGRAVTEMAQLHYTFVNLYWNPAVVKRWVAEKCFASIEKRLGYRLVLKSVGYASNVTRGVAAPLSITIQNAGFAAPINPRSVYVVLRNRSTGTNYPISLGFSATSFRAGQTTTISRPNFVVPTTVPAGSYTMLLNLPDASAALATTALNKFYAIGLVGASEAPVAPGGYQYVWEPATGMNNLLRTVVVA